MSLLPKINYSRVMAWTRRPLCSKSTVIPIQIKVKTRVHDTGKSTETNQPSIYTVENELQQRVCHHKSRLIQNETVPFEHAECQLDGSPLSNFSENRGSRNFDKSTIIPGLNKQESLNEIFTLPIVSVDDGAAEFFVRGINFKKSGNRKPSSHIHTYFKIMYYFGISSYNTYITEPLSIKDVRSACNWTTSKFHLALFLIVAIMNIVKPFCDAKYSLLWFLYEGGLNRFVRLSFHLTCLTTSIHGAFIFCHKWDSVKEMVRVMHSYERNWPAESKVFAFPIVLAIMTTFLASFKTLLIFDLHEYSTENVILHSSSQISEDLFLWTSHNLNTTTDDLYAEFGTNVSLASICLGIPGIIIDFAYNLQQGMVWDLLGNVILAMITWVFSFMTCVKQVKDNVLDPNSERGKTLQTNRVIVWDMYRAIRQVFEACNFVFGPLLYLFHVTNVLRYAFFMEHIIYPDEDTNMSAFRYIDLLYSIVKSEIIYMMAAKIAEQNGVIRKWLRNWALHTGKIGLGYAELDIHIVLDELEKEPLGFGNGNIVIDQRFHFGLIGLVSSLFVMLINKTTGLES